VEPRRTSSSSLPAGWWGGSHHLIPRPRSITELIRDRVLDAELAALAWLLIEARLPVLVTGAPGAGRTTLLTALLDFLPPDARAVPLDGAVEEFEWLPEAPELGWRPERHAHGSRSSRLRQGGITPTSTVLLVSEFCDRPPEGTWGPRARIAIRALSLGYGMAATMTADRLEDVLARLSSGTVGADPDELSRLGLVLVIRAVDDLPSDGEPPRRVVAAHYLRPVVRDSHGHVQRMPPAVLAAHDAGTDRLEHYAWGIVGELAAQTGRRPSQFEREQARRAEYLGGLVMAGIIDPEALRAAIAGFRGTGSGTAN
jgi:energy-coupling factor transporter ATP-binding protein EcfA2